MKLVVGVAVGFLFGTAVWALSSRGATNDPTPIGPKWWPSEWGPGDQRGAGGCPWSRGRVSLGPRERGTRSGELW